MPPEQLRGSAVAAHDECGEEGDGEEKPVAWLYSDPQGLLWGWKGVIRFQHLCCFEPAHGPPFLVQDTSQPRE
jgi:hypothetical protein